VAGVRNRSKFGNAEESDKDLNTMGENPCCSYFGAKAGRNWSGRREAASALENKLYLAIARD
jgi:hypothetical protein